MTIFPIIQPQLADTAAQSALPLCRDVKWDFATNTPIWHDGNPVMETGAAAVHSWAWRALKTCRCANEPHSWNYGCELDSLIGKSFSTAVQKSEAARYVRECLLANPYITDVENITVRFTDDRMDVSCKLITIYGEVSVHAG